MAIPKIEIDRYLGEIFRFFDKAYRENWLLYTLIILLVLGFVIIFFN